jgi:hypothetical protein
MGFRGITVHVYGTYAAYITADGQHVWIRMFRTAEEAMRVYDIAAWRFCYTRSKLNFLDVDSAEEAQFLPPPPLL